jgi:hypothetical protein
MDTEFSEHICFFKSGTPFEEEYLIKSNQVRAIKVVKLLIVAQELQEKMFASKWFFRHFIFLDKSRGVLYKFV